MHFGCELTLMGKYAVDSIIIYQTTSILWFRFSISDRQAKKTLFVNNLKDLVTEHQGTFIISPSRFSIA